jgi:hypothetical protein
MDDKQGNAPDVIIQGAGALATKYHLMLQLHGPGLEFKDKYHGTLNNS